MAARKPYQSTPSKDGKRGKYQPAVEITKDDPENQPHEIIASEILKISRGMQELLNGRLKRDAVIALIHERSKVARGTIAIVLNNLEQLEHYWLKEKGK